MVKIFSLITSHSDSISNKILSEVLKLISNVGNWSCKSTPKSGKFGDNYVVNSEVCLTRDFKLRLQSKYLFFVCNDKETIVIQ